MQKPENISWKDTNLALIGTDIDHKVKEAAAQGEEAWQGIGQEAGLCVWRIEKFQIKPWPEDQYGQFFKGDSYIVLNSSGSGDTLQHDLHIWIGSESTQDEYGTAAYKMVEADETLGGAAVQHRQIEGSEADEFAECFEFLEYLEGGIESGFTKVEPTKENPLFFKFRARDNKKGEVTQVPMAISSMDSGSGFILFADKATVWVWHGKDVSGWLVVEPRVFVCSFVPVSMSVSMSGFVLMIRVLTRLTKRCLLSTARIALHCTPIRYVDETHGKDCLYPPRRKSLHIGNRHDFSSGRRRRRRRGILGLPKPGWWWW